MNEQLLTPEPATGPFAESPADSAGGMRALLHDINNSLEIVMQATYLVGTLELGEDGKQWLKLLEQGVGQVTSQTQRLRQMLIERRIA